MPPASSDEGLYGRPPAELATVRADARRFSPFEPDGESLEVAAEASLGRFVIHAPAGALERRYALAQSLRILRRGGQCIALARKDRGGLRLAEELTAFGCAVGDRPRRHFRICVCERPAATRRINEAIEAGGPQIAKSLGLWSQPGVFSWDRLDPGSALLLDHLPPLCGRGADFGCGVGVLAGAILRQDAVDRLTLVDVDRRAIDAARRNIADPRAAFVHADLRGENTVIADLDFVIMNPPFHLEAAEDRGLGEALIRTAAAALRTGGLCRLVANVMLPYEATLTASFTTVTTIARQGGYKVLEAHK